MGNTAPSGASCGGAVSKSDSIPGGFIPIRVQQLLGIYWAYAEGHIQLLDLRVWFACWLELARRCKTPPGARRRFTVADLQRQVQAVGEGSVRAALRRLERQGLVTWSTMDIQFPNSTSELLVGNTDGLAELLREVGTPTRPVSVPRRLVKAIARGVLKTDGEQHSLSRARLATVLAHLIRCVHWKKGRGINSQGLCSVRWVVEIFGVCRRAVIAARQLLERLGWMRRDERPQRFVNRYGSSVKVNLEWGGGALSTGGSAPPSSLSTGGSAPLKRNQNPSPSENGLRNQNPGGCAAKSPGVSKLREENSAPNIRDVVTEDLRDTGRLLELFEQAQGVGLIRGTEHEKLRFVGAAVRALRRATENPMGFFVRVLRGRLWHFITNEEEDEARRRLRELETGGPQALPPAVGERPKRELSDDARFVQTLRRTLYARGVRSDVFEALNREHPEWTRKRWQHACSEIEKTVLEASAGSLAGGLVTAIA